ncbi:flavin-containing monooxygenase [Nocardia jiangxiensis]|uniref:Flavin-containing monooxygenase n=1 Tax=Nocardia jiangxiensis TaxID=282685 RepID=A0ABW6RRD3_9NOCA|nr:NAD(P)/FAD-dependent oxidoreductase [Nocardia jiangxiensis]
MDATNTETTDIGKSELAHITESANVPTLLMVLYQVTGDRRWLAAPYLPTRTKGLGDHDTGGLPEDVQAEIRQAAVDAFDHLLHGRPPAIDVPTSEQTAEMLGVCVGEPVDDSYGVMLAEEFRRRVGAAGEDSRLEARVPGDFRVLVIGSGVSGIIAAQRFQEMGVPYLMVDKHDSPGGNWLDNRYPGAGVDTPSHLYSYSFAPHDWGHHFELRASLEEYFGKAFDLVGARPNARFGTEVVRAEYDEAEARWRVTLRAADGTTEVLPFNAIVSAVGMLNRPKLPAVSGLDRFRGPSFHSSDWPADLDIAGKRVAVIGNGASAMQIVPAIAGQVGQLTIFQRTPQWIAPFDKFQQPIDEGSRYLLRTFPIYRTWYWLKLYWQFGDKVLDSLRKDPEWPHPERAVNARNDGHREYFTQYIRDELGDRTDLFDKTLPTYPPYGKRILLDNGWYRALRRPNVTLVTDAVESVGETGVVTCSGAAYDADILVWATGFDATRFVSSLDVIGRGGVTLRQAWDDDDARAYLGVTVPGFPNLFLIGGPNSFPGSGSFMYFMEVQMGYIARLFASMFAAGAAAIDVRKDVYEEYSDLVDRTSELTVWTHPGTNTYFRNARGRLLFVSPFRNVEYWTRARKSSIEDYHVLATVPGR